MIIFTVLVQGGLQWHFHGLECKSTREGGHLVVSKGNTPIQPHLKEHAPHTCQIHEHDPRVDARPAVERVTGEAIVPGDAGLLVLWGHSSQLRRIKVRQ